MKLLIVIVHNEEDVNKIMNIFLETGIHGATIIDSAGMGRVISHNIPIFAGLRHLMHSDHPNNKTILSVIENEEILINTKKLLTNTIDFEKPGTGIFFTLPVEDAHGLVKDELDF